MCGAHQLALHILKLGYHVVFLNCHDGPAQKSLQQEVKRIRAGPSVSENFAVGDSQFNEAAEKADQPSEGWSGGSLGFGPNVRM